MAAVRALPDTWWPVYTDWIRFIVGLVDTSGACRPRPGPGSDGGARDSGELVAYAPKQSYVTGTGASAEGAVIDLQYVLKRFKQWALLNVDTAMPTFDGKLPASCHAAQHPSASQQGRAS